MYSEDESVALEMGDYVPETEKQVSYDTYCTVNNEHSNINLRENPWGFLVVSEEGKCQWGIIFGTI